MIPYTWYEKKNVSEGKFQKPVTSKIERAQTEDQKAAINTIMALKNKKRYTVDIINIGDINNWEYDGNVLREINNKFFVVAGKKIEVVGREVSRWSQPFIQPITKGVNAIFVDWKYEKLRCLIQFKGEWGLEDGVGIGPTIQTSNAVKKDKSESVVYEELEKKHNNILFDALQSEEGGRFYREENRNVILETDLDELRKGIGDNYMILDYEDIISLTKKGGIINVQLRSLMACLTTIKI